MVHEDNQSPNSKTLPDLIKEPFIRSSALNKSTVSSQAHICVFHYTVLRWAVSVSWVGQRILGLPLPTGSPLFISRKKVIALRCPVLVEGAASPDSSPYLCPTKYAQAMALQAFAPSLLQNEWLLRPDEIKGAGSGLGSVMASPNSNVPCSLCSSFAKTVNFPVSKHSFQAHSYSPSGAAMPTLTLLPTPVVDVKATQVPGWVPWTLSLPNTSP